MINESQIEFLTERLVERINKANIFFYKKIGSALRQIKELTPSQAHQLVQILKYGGNYDDIVRQIAKYTDLNIQDIDNIFNSYAKRDQLFYEKFYKYRNIPFVPFAENTALKMQTRALANIVKNEMITYTRQGLVGFTINGVFRDMKDTYNYVLDEALLNVSQGKETFESSMRRILKDIGGSGLKTVDYKSGRSVRLDSTVRMHLKSKLRELHNELQQIYGKEFGADGVEITVHENPADDHENVQGRQFSNEEFNKLQNGGVAIDYKGKAYSLDHDDNGSHRPISEMNCYHYIFSIVLGVSKPTYTDEELQKKIDDNNKGFILDGKHYSLYEGTQLQRQLERAIREQKDIQILAKSSDDMELVGTAQSNITKLTQKYKELSQVSGLPTKMKRLTVSGYRRTKTK
jgi:hypothetical protein